MRFEPYKFEFHPDALNAFVYSSGVTHVVIVLLVWIATITGSLDISKKVSFQGLVLQQVEGGQDFRRFSRLDVFWLNLDSQRLPLRPQDQTHSDEELALFYSSFAM
ncbi:hypothetical protein EJ02DRAFT_245134 [Clathrospora elynae]|uniref:Uncharacterized protein n=1 Tax=Clathrospora elynae TaxID=706981 RepID=A0A6A5SGV2_9PLEO|nr:hypothetical protein EJ02DRAFT_245134 [Clathrospora elynae]